MSHDVLLLKANVRDDPSFLLSLPPGLWFRNGWQALKWDL